MQVKFAGGGGRRARVDVGGESLQQMALVRVGQRTEDESGDVVRGGCRVTGEQGEDVCVSVGEDTAGQVGVSGCGVEGVSGEPVGDSDPVQALPGDRAAAPGLFTEEDDGRPVDRPSVNAMSAIMAGGATGSRRRPDAAGVLRRHLARHCQL